MAARGRWHNAIGIDVTVPSWARSLPQGATRRRVQSGYSPTRPPPSTFWRNNDQFQFRLVPARIGWNIRREVRAS